MSKAKIPPLTDLPFRVERGKQVIRKILKIHSDPCKGFGPVSLYVFVYFNPLIIVL